MTHKVAFLDVMDGNVSRMVAHRLAGFEVEIIYSDIRRADMATEKSCAPRRCRSMR